MAIPKKKRRTITVNGIKYYWRKESNICLYIENGGNPNFVIKAFFSRGYFAVPKIVRTVIDYVSENNSDNLSFIELHNASEIFKLELEYQEQKRIEERNTKLNTFMNSQVWTKYDLAKKYISENRYLDATKSLADSIFYDTTNPYSWRLLNNLINENNKSASLYNERAWHYRKLSILNKKDCYKEAISDIEKALELDSNFARAYGTLAEILYDKKDIEGFYLNLEKALQKGMTESIDREIEFELKDDLRYIELIENSPL